MGVCRFALFVGVCFVMGGDFILPLSVVGPFLVSVLLLCVGVSERVAKFLAVCTGVLLFVGGLVLWFGFEGVAGGFDFVWAWGLFCDGW